MKTENEKLETKVVEGNVTFVSETKTTKEGEKKFVDVGIATNKVGEELQTKTVRVWENTKGMESDYQVKKGDFIKFEGYEKTLPILKEGDKAITIYNATEVKEIKPIERITVIGNLGADPEIKQVGKEGEPKKTVATLSIAITTPQGTEWKRVQFWDDKAKLVENFKKGDTITVTGKEGKEYTYQKDSQTLTAKDIIANTVEKQIKKTKEEINQDLVINAQKGDWKAVSDDLKKGGNSKLITEEHLKDLSPKQADAIKNTIRSHEDFIAKNDEKKNNSIKI